MPGGKWPTLVGSATGTPGRGSLGMIHIASSSVAQIKTSIAIGYLTIRLCMEIPPSTLHRRFDRGPPAASSRQFSILACMSLSSRRGERAVATLHGARRAVPQNGADFQGCIETEAHRPSGGPKSTPVE